jgi:tetratricopeptide (TPR) repeat protein
MRHLTLRTRLFAALALAALPLVLIAAFAEPGCADETEDSSQLFAKLREQMAAQDDDAKVTVISIVKMAASRVRAKKLAEAESIYRDLLSPCERLYGSDSLEVGQLYFELSLVCNSQKRYEEAKKSCSQALAIQQKSKGGFDPSLVPLLHALADIELKLFHDRAADAICQRTVAIMEKAKGPDSLEVATALMAYT